MLDLPFTSTITREGLLRLTHGRTAPLPLGKCLPGQQPSITSLSRLRVLRSREHIGQWYTLQNQLLGRNPCDKGTIDKVARPKLAFCRSSNGKILNIIIPHMTIED